MNPAQLKCLAVFAVFAVIGFGPVSPGCLIGMYVVAMRPEWFWRLLNDVYAGLPAATALTTDVDSRTARLKCFLGLLVLFIADIAPVPVTPPIAAAILLIRPAWFYRVAAHVYGRS